VDGGEDGRELGAGGLAGAIHDGSGGRTYEQALSKSSDLKNHFIQSSGVGRRRRSFEGMCWNQKV
jgi:hypothetical protein